MARKKKEQTTESKPVDLKKELKDAVAALKATCKDAAFFDSQMDRILSLKGQVDVEPVRIAVWEKDVKKEVKGDTYYLALTKDKAVYHAYGGYTVVADSRNASSLYMTIAGMLGYLEHPDKTLDDVFPTMLIQKEEEEGRKLTPSETEAFKAECRKSLDTDFEAKLHVLNAPSWCYCDLSTTYEIATTVVSTLNTLTENAFNQPLQEEDTEANADFEDAVRGAEHIGRLIEEEKKEKADE